MGAERVDVRTAADMAEAVLRACSASRADVLLMAAAVADFCPARTADQKLKRARGVPTVTLEPAPDILAAVARQRQETGRPHVVVGFAAETEDLLANARAKLQTKELDIIAANDVSASDAGFAVDTNRVTLLDADGIVEELPLLSKAEVAEKIVEKVIAKLKRET
jgi:phosphopantothenoylcysteine decarboxylase/phosphopantothenate--cysteine ligase